MVRATNLFNVYLPSIFSQYEYLLDISRNFVVMFEEGKIIAQYPAVNTNSTDILDEGTDSYYQLFDYNGRSHKNINK